MIQTQDYLAKVQADFRVRWITSGGVPGASGNYPQGIRDRSKRDHLVLADVLPVDLDRDRPARADPELWLVMQADHVPAAERRAARGNHLAQCVQRAHSAQPAEREKVEPSVEIRSRARVYRPVAEIRPRRRIRHDAHEQVPDGRPPVALQGQRGVPAVGDRVELAQRGPYVEPGG